MDYIIITCNQCQTTWLLMTRWRARGQSRSSDGSQRRHVGWEFDFFAVLFSISSILMFCYHIIHF